MTLDSFHSVSCRQEIAFSTLGTIWLDKNREFSEFNSNKGIWRYTKLVTLKLDELLVATMIALAGLKQLEQKSLGALTISYPNYQLMIVPSPADIYSAATLR